MYRGGRNTGLKGAQGRYIVFLDADDLLIPNSLCKLKEILEQEQGGDLLMYNYREIEADEIRHIDFKYPNRPIDGKTFMVSYRIPWTAWTAIYRREFLLENNIDFAENVWFEDVDFTIKCIVTAKKVLFTTNEVLDHIIWKGQTVKQKYDRGKVEDLFKLSCRVKKIAEEELKCNIQCGKAILAHHFFMHKMNIMRYLWRVSYMDMIVILKNYPVYMPTDSFLLGFSTKNPKFFSFLLQCSKPIIPLVRLIYLYLGRRNK